MASASESFENELADVREIKEHNKSSDLRNA